MSENTEPTIPESTNTEPEIKVLNKCVNTEYSVKDCNETETHKIIKRDKIKIYHNNYHDFCMVINYMIISGTLIMITFFLYGLTNELKKFQIDNITNEISSLDNNLDKIQNLGNKITFYIEQLRDSNINDFNVNRLNQFIYDVNNSLIRLNNGLDNLEPKISSEIDVDNQQNTPEIIPEKPL